jgi:hypothetical protein
MECPFCAETVKDEAIACKHCSRDLRIVRPVILEIQELAIELDALRRELDHVNARLDRMRNPGRAVAIQAFAYVLLPAILLVAAHVVVTIVLNVSPIYLRLASVLIPLPFGFAIYPIQRIGLRGAFVVWITAAILSVTCMLVVTGINDRVPILPSSWLEWREVIEYSASIALAFVTGNILGIMVFRVLPGTLSKGGKPNAAAYKIALMLGRHVGEHQLRRRARVIQELMRTAGPLAGVLATAIGSIYAGLKGVLGS